MKNPELTVTPINVSKYLLVNINNNVVIVASIVSEYEIIDAINQYLTIAGERNVKAQSFFNSSSISEHVLLSNGTTLQYLYLAN